MDNCAYLSRGQVRRLESNGDHFKLLGLDEKENGIDSIIDRKTTKSAIRIRSGGRAATFFANNGKYSFTDVKDKQGRKIPIMTAS